MTIASLKSSQKATAMREVLASNDVRTLIAHQLGVDVKRVTDEAHFTDDLGADWLDRLELMIVIGDRFADVVITDEDADQLEVVGDLIRHIETWTMKANDPPPSRRRSSDPQVMVAFSSRAVEPAEQQERCEQVVIRRRSATYVEGVRPVSREDLSGVIVTARDN
jgi:acyl carrier protein